MRRCAQRRGAGLGRQRQRPGDGGGRGGSKRWPEAVSGEAGRAEVAAATRERRRRGRGGVLLGLAGREGESGRPGAEEVADEDRSALEARGGLARRPDAAGQGLGVEPDGEEGSRRAGITAVSMLHRTSLLHVLATILIVAPRLSSRHPIPPPFAARSPLVTDMGFGGLKVSSLKE